MERRTFLFASALSGAAMVVPSRILFGAETPSNTVNLAVIGAGGRGAENIRELRHRKLARIAVLCDVDEARASSVYRLYPEVPKYRDFRKLLERERGIDAVLVATPDHTHAPATLAAIRHGKHVYCEKPLTHTVEEARIIARAAREAGVATQMGNQGMAFEGNRLLNEWIDAGVIGAVREVHAWSDRPTHAGRLMWAQGVERPRDTPTPPATLDWDLWLGPAPERPYHPAYVPFAWRGWWDFGSGGLGDMGIHNLAPVFSALRLGAPESVDASSTLFNEETLPLASTVHYRFPARRVDLGSAARTGFAAYPAPASGAGEVEMPAVAVHWYDGGLLPPRPEELRADEVLNPEDGIMLVGDKGKILVEGWGGERPRLLPTVRMEEFSPPPPRLPRSIGHHAEWLAACKGGPPARSNFDFSGPLTEAVLLGVAAVRAGGVLRWDAARMEAKNCAGMDGQIRKAYRKGWELE